MAIPHPHKRRWEIAVVVILYGLVFVFFIGPFIGRMTGFERPAFLLNLTTETGRVSLLRAFTTVRGWILFMTLAVVMFSYIYLRPRVTGHDPDTFWKDGE